MLHLITILLFLFASAKCEVYPTTKVFIYPIEPKMFNWTTLPLGDEYIYHASLLKYPDLPKWIQYIYSPRHRKGFLFGSPPKYQNDVEIEVVAMNSRTYETSRRVLHFDIEDKEDAAKFEVYLKIDNLNVEEFFDPQRLNSLMDIFKSKLWKDSYIDLYVTFITSATSLGARLPLKPNEGEGVVMKLGSQADFSTSLIELQEEVKPLWKLQICPRDFKRTTVERLFREKGFLMDWCSFKLIENFADVSKVRDYSNDDDLLPDLQQEPMWTRPAKSQVPVRSYVSEFIFTIIIPMLVMLVLVLILSAVLCFQHEGISKRKAEESDEQIMQYTAVVRATSTLRSLTTQVPEQNGTDSRSATSSPQNMSHTQVNGYSRPTPPPYHGPVNRNAHVDF